MPAAVPAEKQSTKVNGAVEPAEDTDIAELISLLTQCKNAKGFLSLKDIGQENQVLQKELTEAKSANEGNIKAASDALSRADTNSRELEKCRDELKAADTREKRLQNSLVTNQGQLNASAEETTKLMEKIKQQESKISELEKAKDAQAKEVKSAQDKKRNVENQLEARDKELTQKAKDISGLQKKLMTIEKFQVELQPLKSIEQETTASFRAIFVSALDFLKDFLYQDLPEDILKDTAMWDKAKQSHIVLRSRIPLPASNSPNAKHMRLALGLTILSQALILYIFQPSYISVENNDMSECLKDLRDANPEHECHARSILLGMLRETQLVNGEARAEAAATATCDELLRFIPKDRQEAFTTGIIKVCFAILSRWEPMQKVQEEIVARKEAEEDDDWWRPLPLVEGSSTTKVQPGSASDGGGTKSAAKPNSKGPSSSGPVDFDNILYVTWPAFVADDPEDNEKLNIIQRGFVLTKAQAEEATAEVRKQESLRRSERDRRRTADGQPNGGLAGRRRDSVRSQRPFLPPGHGDTSPAG